MRYFAPDAKTLRNQLRSREAQSASGGCEAKEGISLKTAKMWGGPWRWHSFSRRSYLKAARSPCMGNGNSGKSLPANNLELTR
jgi:hypothetical protein